MSTHPNGDAERAGPRVQSVDRALDILQHLAQHGWSGVTEVGQALGVHKSTAFRLLSTLESRGVVEQHVDSGKYHLGFGLVHLARAVTVDADVTRHAQGACRRLTEETGETVTLGVLEGDEVVTIDQIIPDSSVVSRSWLGRRTPLHATSHGKVFLAWLPEARRLAIVEGRHEAFTEHTIVGSEELADEIAGVRERGWGSAVDELEDGLSAVAAPVRGADGTVVAALSVAGPSYRLDADLIPKYADLLTDACAEVSQRFGWSGAVAG